MWCYISKRSFTNVNLLNSPNSWGVVISQTGLPQNSISPPYNDVVLHSKANFNKSQPPQFPQQKSQNMGSLGDNCSPPNFWSETQKTKPTKQNKQTNKQKHKAFWWHHDHASPPYLLPRPLPPPLPQTVIPYWNCDAICQIRLGKYRPFPSPSRILCFLAKIDPFPQNYNSFNEIDRPTIVSIQLLFRK